MTTAQTKIRPSHTLTTQSRIAAMLSGLRAHGDAVIIGPDTIMTHDTDMSAIVWTLRYHITPRRSVTTDRALNDVMYDFLPRDMVPKQMTPAHVEGGVTMYFARMLFAPVTADRTSIVLDGGLPVLAQALGIPSVDDPERIASRRMTTLCQVDLRFYPSEVLLYAYKENPRHCAPLHEVTASR